jgi:hypothetical protein
MFCSSRRLCADFKAVIFVSLTTVSMTWYSIRMLNCPSIIHPDDENFLSEPSFVSRSFVLFQLASVRTSQQHVRMPLSVWLAMRFLSKTQICGDSCNRLDDVCSRPNVLIHKASSAFKIQTSGHQSSWSGRSSFIDGNCVHQINCPDDRCYGPNAPSLDMEIACCKSATVWTLGQHCPDAAQFRKEFSAKFG